MRAAAAILSTWSVKSVEPTKTLFDKSHSPWAEREAAMGKLLGLEDVAAEGLFVTDAPKGFGEAGAKGLLASG